VLLRLAPSTIDSSLPALGSTAPRPPLPSDRGMSDPTPQVGAAEDSPSNEMMIIFGSDIPSEEFVEQLERETAAALEAGVASLPGNVDAPHALVESILMPYQKNMDVLERFCVGSIFSVSAHSRSRQDEIVATIQKIRMSGDNDFATHLAESRGGGGGGNSSSAASDALMEEDEMVEGLSSADDVPTDEQVLAAQEQVADLRIRLAQLQRQKDVLARQAEAWTDLNFVAAAGTEKSAGDGEDHHGASNNPSVPLLCPDDANKVHDLVSSAVVGTSMLADLHQQGNDLLQQIQDRPKYSSTGGGGMEEEEEDDEENDGSATIRRAAPCKRKTLEEHYAEDRAVLGSSEEPPSAVIKQLLRQLRTGKENTEKS
jgi:hypothetical protein